MSWEDPRIEQPVFALDRDDHVITIASAGDNALDYIIDNAKVTAVDFNLCQIALTELKVSVGATHRVTGHVASTHQPLARYPASRKPKGRCVHPYHQTPATSYPQPASQPTNKPYVHHLMYNSTTCRTHALDLKPPNHQSPPGRRVPQPAVRRVLEDLR